MICVWLLDLKKLVAMYQPFVVEEIKSAWLMWAVCIEASEAFLQLSQYQLTIDDAILDVLKT